MIAARRKTHRLVLQRRLEVGRRLVPLRLPVQLHVVAIWRPELVRRSVTEVTIAPAFAESHFFNHRDPSLQRFRPSRAERHVPHFGKLAGGQLQGVELVVVPAAQVHRLALTAALGHAHAVDEEVQTLLRFRCEQLHVPEVCQVEGSDG